MNLQFVDENTTAIYGGIIAGTCALWLAGQFAGSSSSAHDDAIIADAPASLCAKRCTLATYEHAGITEVELSKLQSSASFLKWLRANEAAIAEREAGLERDRMWQSLAVLTVVVFATLVLPFNSFALYDAEPKSLNHIIAETEPLPRKIAALTGLGALVCSLFVSPSKAFANTVAVLGLVVCLVAGDAMTSPGAGFLTLLTAVAARLFVVS